MGQGKDRLRIKQFSFLSETFSDLWIPRAIELLLGRKESVFDSCSIQNRFLCQNQLTLNGEYLQEQGFMAFF